MIDTLVAITGCEFFEYTRRAVESCLETAPSCRVVIIDDASTKWPKDDVPHELKELAKNERVSIERFHERFGLTRSMNLGARIARDGKYPYCAISNNDVIFTPHWHEVMVQGLEHYDLVGPLSNAPGPTAQGRQDIGHWSAGYTLSDAKEHLAEEAEYLFKYYASFRVESPVNGFMFMARTATWWKHAYDAVHEEVFNPKNHFNSRGIANPTPTMTLMEDEFQRRLYAAGGRSAVCPGAFVFHYRSVWRGDKYKQGKWCRMRNAGG